MKTTAIAKELVKLVPGFKYHKSLIYKDPIGNILIGFSIDKGFHCVITKFIMPLYVPYDNIHFTYSNRLKNNDNRNILDFSDTAKSTALIEEMSTIINKEKLDILSLEDYKNLIVYCEGHKNEPNMLGLLTIAYTTCFLDLGRAKTLIQEINNRLLNKSNLSDWEKTILINNEELLESIDNGTYLKKLEQFRVYTLRHIGLSKIVEV